MFLGCQSLPETAFGKYINTVHSLEVIERT
jgi:hypothetical protein